MNRYVLFLTLAFAVAATALTAQTTTPAPTPAAAVCLSSGTLDELVKSLDDAISGPADKDRTCLRSVLMPSVTLTPLTRAEDGSATPHTLQLEDWISAVQTRGSTPLFERQVKFTSDTFGPLAHIWSTYEIRATADGPATSRGINSIQAIFDGKRWRIFEVLWFAETPGAPIPAKYLP